MTRTHAAIQLLRLGPLSRTEFEAITGWPKAVAHGMLGWLVQSGQIEYVGNTRRGIYRVPA
jgi:DNA-binding IclR family transcriptional regulator